MQDAKPTVHILDADAGARDRIAGLVASAGWQARQYECARDFLQSPPSLEPGCLVLDEALPDCGGLEVQADVSRQHAQLSVIFTTERGDVPTTVRAMKAGAVEFLVKPLDEDAVLDAIEIALMRSRAVLRNQAHRETLADRYAALSPREREVMALVVAGLLNKEAAYRLGISEITVKAHRGRVMDKMCARSLADLVRMSAALEGPSSPIADIGVRQPELAPAWVLNLRNRGGPAAYTEGRCQRDGA